VITDASFRDPSRPGGEQDRWETDGGRTDNPIATARHAQAEHVARQLTAVTDRLCRQFAPDCGAPAPAAAIRELVGDVRAGFGSPRVIAYLLGARRTSRPPPVAPPAPHHLGLTGITRPPTCAPQTV